MESTAEDMARGTFPFLFGFFVVAMIASPQPAAAHGFAGKRFFPATLATDDPFVADELSLPTVATGRTPATEDEPSTRETEVSAEFSKRITQDFGISVGAEYRQLKPDGMPNQSGFGNLELGFKYQVYTSAPHETIVSVGLGWEAGGSGRKAVHADSFSTLTPTLFFGKGFGDLPSSLDLLKPLALTGTIGVAIPTRTSTATTTVDPTSGNVDTGVTLNPNILQVGLAVEYSLPYLQSFVRDSGIPAPFNRMIPLVELFFENPLDRGMMGQLTGTINPGVIWAGRYVQLGLEAIIPVNARTGTNVGVRMQLHFFLDDLFPHSIGRPLFAK